MERPIRKLATQRMIAEIPIIEVVQQKQQDDALPLVILYHGWRNSKELMQTQARRLADEGMRVILPDAMNHGERSRGEISIIPSITFWSSIHYSLAEFDLLINDYREKNLIEGEKIGVGGYSMGSIIAFMLLTHRPNIWATASIMGSPSPVRYRERIRLQAKKWGYYYPNDMADLLSWLERYDLSLHPAKIDHRPLFIWHDESDERVPFDHSYQFYEAIKDQPYAENVTFSPGEGEGHFVTTALMDRITHFFKTSFYNHH